VKIHSGNRLVLETSAFESLYCDPFALSTQLMKPNYLVKLPTDAAPNFLQKLTPLFIAKPEFLGKIKRDEVIREVIRESKGCTTL